MDCILNLCADIRFFKDLERRKIPTILSCKQALELQQLLKAGQRLSTRIDELEQRIVAHRSIAKHTHDTEKLIKLQLKLSTLLFEADKCAKALSVLRGVYD